LAVQVYVPWSVGRWRFSMVNVPFATRCHMFVGNLMLSGE